MNARGAMLGNSDKIASRRIQLRGSRLRQRRCTRNFPGSDPETSAYARSPSGVEIRPKDPSSRQLGITVRDIRPLALLLHIPTESIRMFYFRGRYRGLEVPSARTRQSEISALAFFHNTAGIIRRLVRFPIRVE